MNETGAIRRQEYNRISYLVCGSRTDRRRLGSELLQALGHGAGAFGARRTGANRINPDAAWPIFRPPRLSSAA